MLIGLKIIILLVVAAGVVLLQIFLSKKEGKGFGLILPMLTFIISLIMAVSIVAYTNIGIATHSVSEEGVIVTFEIEDTRPEFNEVVWQVVQTFLLYNISTVILLTIYAACREKRKRSLEMEKMQIQDLE